MEDLLDGLNPEQRRAALHDDGPLLVLAGAGSGKTRVLTLRIARLLRDGRAAPWELLAVTFTNKAAREMRDRVDRLVGAGAGDVRVSTFHSTCLRFLRRDIERLGFSRNFVVYDDRDSKDLVRRIVKERSLPSTVSPRAISAAIDRAKNDGLDPSGLEAQRRPEIPAQTAEVYRLYQERLRQADALDFGDLILHTVRLLEGHPDLLEHYRRRIRYLLVDEYQDTNHIQYRLVKLLADHGDRNLCVVGDEDQSIYSFRGADIRNILDFERDFPGAEVVRLERNYRSTGTILSAATAVVERNQARKGKVLWTDKGQGEPIRLEVAYDDREEARTAADIVRREIRRGRMPRDLAVFFRANSQSRLLEEEFLAARLPFVLLGGQRFYDRKEVKDALAYLKLVANPRDEVSMLRVLNEPPRGIGAKTVSAVLGRAQRLGVTPWDALRGLSQDERTKPRTRAALAAFVELIDGLGQAARTERLPDLLTATLERSGMLPKLRREADAGDHESLSRIGNLEELVSSTVDYAGLPPDEALPTFLDRVSLVADTDKLQDPEENEAGVVTLMTVHSAKGLEFPVVVVVGMDEGLFPHSRASTNLAELEEERRLAYVAITRAEEQLYLLRARRRARPGSGEYGSAQPSRFLREIPRELLAGAVPSAPHRAPPPPSVVHRGDSFIEYDEPRPGRVTGLGRPRRSPPAPPPRQDPAAFRSRFAQRRSGANPGPFVPPAPPASAPERPGQQALFGASSAPRPPEPPRPEAELDEPRVVADADEVASMLGVGTRVLHPRWGEGEIRELSGPPENRRATVFFRRVGRKQVYLRSAELEILSR